MQQLILQLKTTRPDLMPQVLFVDGNGTLHPHRFGSACHIGVLENISTIGIAKNFLSIPSAGLTMDKVKQDCKERLQKKGDVMVLQGNSSSTDMVYGAALRTGSGTNPIFVSPGHKITLETAVDLTLSTCKFRIPEVNFRKIYNLLFTI
jgi:endonuclease V